MYMLLESEKCLMPAYFCMHFPVVNMFVFLSTGLSVCLCGFLNVK